MKPGHTFSQNGTRDDRHRELAQHAKRSLPANQPRAAFPRPDLPRKKLQTSLTQNPGKHAVIGHLRIVSQAPGPDALASNHYGQVPPRGPSTANDRRQPPCEHEANAGL